MSAPKNTLQLLANEPQRIQFGPYEIEVTPITVGKLPALLRHLGPLLEKLEYVHGPEDAITLLTDNSEGVNEAIAIAADLSVEQVRALTLDVAGDLLLALLEVNADFFGRLPALAERGRAAAQRIRGAETKRAGPTSSPG